MKLQVALDVNKKKALGIADKVKEQVDILELGTPLIKQEGLGVVEEFKKFGKSIFADLKTMDTGFLESEMAFKAGADITSVCGAADDNTILGAIKAGEKYNKKVLVDLISVESVEKRAKEADKMGADYIGVHSGIDAQKEGANPLSDLEKVSKAISNRKIAVAGGIDLENIDRVMEQQPEIVVVGSAITKSKNPSEITRELKKTINGYSG